MKAQLLLFVVVLVALIFCFFPKLIQKSKFSHSGGDSRNIKFQTADVPQGYFDNSMYDYGNPAQWREQYYKMCVTGECAGDTSNYDCLQRCRLKTFRVDKMTPDHADLVCGNYKFDEDSYYKCLADVYANYKYP
jgi:hypothetical protein